MSLLIKGVTTFIGLTDTPASYAGQQTKVPKVKAAQDGLEFLAVGFTGTTVFDGQTASPPTRYLTPLTTYPNRNPSGSGAAMQRSFAIAVNGEIYVGGGRYATVGIYNNQWWKYTIATGKWTRLANLPGNYGGTVNSRGHVGHHAGKIYIRAEYLENNHTQHLLIYDIAGNSWSTLATWGALYDHKYLMAPCSDALYLSVDSDFRKINYATLAITDLANMPADARVGGNIGDEIRYAGMDNKTYLYNKGADSWGDQDQPIVGQFYSGCWVEDFDAFWAVGEDDHKFYKYTPAGGWVAQFTYGRNCRAPDYLFVFTGENIVYAYWDNPESYSGFTDNVVSGTIQYYNPTTLLWELLAMTLNAGDFLVVDTGQSPVYCELDGLYKFTATGLSTTFIMETGRYRFTMSKDYPFANTKIYRAVWG